MLNLAVQHKRDNKYESNELLHTKSGPTYKVAQSNVSLSLFFNLILFIGFQKKVGGTLAPYVTLAPNSIMCTNHQFRDTTTTQPYTRIS